MIKSVTVGIQRVINLGNYENVRYECSCTYEVEDDENEDIAYEYALAFCKQKVGAEVDRLMEHKGKK